MNKFATYPYAVVAQNLALYGYIKYNELWYELFVLVITLCIEHYGITIKTLCILYTEKVRDNLSN